MNEFIISLVPTAGMLLLGAIVWYTDPWVRSMRKQEARRR
jgi:hypothetical protein